MVMSPQVSWLFFKARAKRPYLSHTGRASNAEKQPTGRGPEGCVENGPAAALLVGYVSIQICALSASPARTALPTAHFERNDVTIICETVHWVAVPRVETLIFVHNPEEPWKLGKRRSMVRKNTGWKPMLHCFPDCRAISRAIPAAIALHPERRRDGVM
jgi:hypothetical protein